MKSKAHSEPLGFVRAFRTTSPTDAVDCNVVPNYKQTWANIRRVGSNAEYKRKVSFKSRRYAI